MLHWCPVWGLGKPLGGAEGLSRDALGHQQRRWMFPFQHLLLSPAVKWSLAEPSRPLSQPAAAKSYRELVRTLRGATSAAQMSRPNHPLPESPATRAGRLAIFLYRNSKKWFRTIFFKKIDY
ncbi:unnamed protein product [Gadus morhua 'NCC']